MKFHSSALAFVLAIPTLVLASPLDVRSTIASVEKRQTYYEGEASWYYVNGSDSQTGGISAGACGEVYQDSDQVVALPVTLWDSGSHCFQWITIWATDNPENSQGALVVDLCEGCVSAHGSGAIDLSPSLFTLFAPESQGLVEVAYFFQS